MVFLVASRRLSIIASFSSALKDPVTHGSSACDTATVK
jgi:hypothetical protein